MAKESKWEGDEMSEGGLSVSLSLAQRDSAIGPMACKEEPRHTINGNIEISEQGMHEQLAAF